MLRGEAVIVASEWYAKAIRDEGGWTPHIQGGSRIWWFCQTSPQAGSTSPEEDSRWIVFVHTLIGPG